MWAYFTVLDANLKLAKCNMCGMKTSYRSTTTNLKSHLSRKHPTVNLKVSDNGRTSHKSLQPGNDDNLGTIRVRFGLLGGSALPTHRRTRKPLQAPNMLDLLSSACTCSALSGRLIDSIYVIILSKTVMVCSIPTCLRRPVKDKWERVGGGEVVGLNLFKSLNMFINTARKILSTRAFVS